MKKPYSIWLWIIVMWNSGHWIPWCEYRERAISLQELSEILKRAFEEPRP